MTYLTQMRINPARRGAMHLLGSPQAMHAAVLAGYSAADPGRVLWRTDHGPQQQVTLYVVGALQPDLTHLVEQAGWPTTEAWRTTSYLPFLQRLDEHQHWRFRLVANPVYSEAPVDGAKRGRLRPHVTVAQQEAWVRGKALGWGFEPLPAEEGGLVVMGRDRDSFNKSSQDVRSHSGRRRVTIARAVFDGTLRITDADTLRRYLVTGMGRAKAYGCGLMTLAPARS